MPWTKARGQSCRAVGHSASSVESLGEGESDAVSERDGEWAKRRWGDRAMGNDG
jgi:hypothetical protein